MTRTVWYGIGEDYAPSAAVRKTVFVEEQGYTLQEEFDDFDKTCPHLVLFDGETPVATGRLVLLENGTANPSLRTLRRLADAMGKKVKIEFISAD